MLMEIDVTRRVEVMRPLALEVFSPSGATKPTEVGAPRLADLNGKTICELSNYAYFQEEQTFAELERLVGARYPGVKFVAYSEFPSTLYPMVKGLVHQELTAETLRTRGCQAVISGNGG